MGYDRMVPKAARKKGRAGSGLAFENHKKREGILFPVLSTHSHKTYHTGTDEPQRTGKRHG
jgi:hypothetical protein